MSYNHPSDRVIEIRAKYAGTCSHNCNHRILPGETVFYDRSSKKVAHKVCPQLQKSIDVIRNR